MRTRRMTRFTAPFVMVVASCGGAGGGDDDGVGDDDAGTGFEGGGFEDNGFDPPVTENPPSPWLGVECWVQPAQPAHASACEEDVCSDDPGCCTTAWDERCVALTAYRCDVLRCVTEIATGGDGAIAVQSALYDDVSHTIPLAGDGLVRSAAWTLGGLAVASDCAGRILEDDPTQAGLQFVSRFADAPDGCVFGGKRARWADLDHDADLDVVFVAADGVSWIQRGTGGWQDEGTIVAAGGAALADVALLDADGDHDLDLVVAFADGAARRYLQDDGAFVLDATWTSAGSGFTTVEACDVAGDAAREVVLAGPTGTEIVGIAPGLPAASAIGCGILNGNTAKDEIALLGADGHVRVVTGAGTVRWDSALDLDPPLTVAGTGIAVGSADFEPIVSDIVIAVSGATGAVPFVTLSPSGDTFTVGSAPDPAPDSEAHGVQLTDPGGY